MSSGFTEASFADKLGKLSSTQASIQSLSMWLLHHHARATDAAFIWLKYLKSGSFASG